MKTVKSLQEIAELVDSKVWAKNGYERVYLDNMGYSTKKATARVYIYSPEPGEVLVGATVECASQPQAWCDGQRRSLIEGVSQWLLDILLEADEADEVRE